MFKELSPYLRQRAVLLTVTHLEDDRIRVNLIPQKLKDGENSALTTPLTLTGTAEELDRDLPSAIVSFVSAHLQLRNTLEWAKAEMDAAAKAAQAEARAKSKTPQKKDGPKPETTASIETPKPEQPELPKTASLFDAPAPVVEVSAAEVDNDEEAEILAEANASSETEDDDLEDTA
jgi:PRTRC genetic system protein E